MDFRELRRRARRKPPHSAAPAAGAETALPEDEAILSFVTTEQPEPEPTPSPPLPLPPTAVPAPAGGALTDAIAAEPSDVDSFAAEEDYGDRIEVLRFRLHREWFAIPLSEIEEIIKPKQYTWVPRTPTWVLGIVSLRGTMVPVIDLRRRLAIPASDGSSQRIIVIAVEEDLCGLLVDEVKNVEDIRPENIEPLPAALAETAGRFLSGLVRIDVDLVALIDLKAVLAVEGMERERAQ